jgi:hypothetical protein
MAVVSHLSELRHFSANGCSTSPYIAANCGQCEDRPQQPRFPGRMADMLAANKAFSDRHNRHILQRKKSKHFPRFDHLVEVT